MDQATATQNRRSDRSHVLLSATLEMHGRSFPVTLRNLSERGALVAGKMLPGKGSRVLFHREGLAVPGVIAWVEATHAGMEFDVHLFPKELLRQIAPAEPKEQVAMKRRPGLRSQPLTPVEMEMMKRWMAHSPHTLGD